MFIGLVSHVSERNGGNREMALNEAIVQRALKALRALNRNEPNGGPPPTVTHLAQTWKTPLGYEVDKQTCIHCNGQGSCDCISCGEYRVQMVWSGGQCRVCKARSKQAAVIQ